MNVCSTLNKVKNDSLLDIQQNITTQSFITLTVFVLNGPIEYFWKHLGLSAIKVDSINES